MLEDAPAFEGAAGSGADEAVAADPGARAMFAAARAERPG
jgi:hypothetical protein